MFQVMRFCNCGHLLSVYYLLGTFHTTFTNCLFMGLSSIYVHFRHTVV